WPDAVRGARHARGAGGAHDRSPAAAALRCSRGSRWARGRAPRQKARGASYGAGLERAAARRAGGRVSAVRAGRAGRAGSFGGAGGKLPWKVVLAAVVARGGLGVVALVVFSSESPEGPGPAPGASGVAVPAPESDAPVVMADPALVPEAVRREVARIEALLVYKRSYADWLSFAHGTAQMGRHKDSTRAYQA